MNPFQTRLIEFISFLKTIELDETLSNYEHLVKEKSSEIHEKLFMNIYQVYRTDILNANFQWILNKDIKISFGKSGKSCIKLSQIYKKANADQRVQIEALFIFCIIECLKDEEKNSVENVSKKYVLADEIPSTLPILGNLNPESKNLFGNIVGKLKDKFEDNGIQGNDDNINPEAITKVVGTLMNDQQLQQDIFKFAQQLNLPALLGNLGNLGNLFPQQENQK